MTGQMKKSVNPVPTGFHTVTTCISVPGVAKIIDFVKNAFNGEELFRMDAPNGSIAHAEVKVGDSIVMFGEPCGEWGPRPCNLYLYMKNVDVVYKQALAAGGKSIQEPKDQFYGDRSCGVEDPGGNYWWIATHIEDVPPEELGRRMAALQQQK
jgi:PhnB protein